LALATPPLHDREAYYAPTCHFNAPGKAVEPSTVSTPTFLSAGRANTNVIPMEVKLSKNMRMVSELPLMDDWPAQLAILSGSIVLEDERAALPALVLLPLPQVAAPRYPLA